MNPPENNDPFEAWLREQNPHIDDADFTARVVSVLPRQRARFRLPQALLLGTGAIGSVVAALWLPWASLPALNAAAMLSFDLQVLWPWAMVVLVAASLTWAVVAAIQTED